MNDHKLTCATVAYEEQDKALHATYLHDQDVYRRTWPKHCTHCKGWGVFTSEYDPSPAGVSLSAGTMTDMVACYQCLEVETCPRCMEPAPFMDGAGVSVCSGESGCGFVEGETEGISEEPQLAECDCWGFDDVEQLEAGSATS